jgi:hypothetical protein
VKKESRFAASSPSWCRLHHPDDAEVAVVFQHPAPQTSGHAAEDGVVEGCPAQVLGRAVQPLQPGRGERDRPAGPDAPVERRGVMGSGELPAKEADQVSAAAYIVIGM